ncbi:MAG: alpha/beta fold hydrolase [Phycisphaerae bacterium]|jgi:pimeloyl-ACP methyl ester carboxylesterase/quercetin dioxygenase-like cupin family protein
MNVYVPLSVLSCVVTAWGADEQPARIESSGMVLEGAWLFPDAVSRVPCVVIAGGTMSHTRDGALSGVGAAGAQRDALRRLARRLAEGGYASLRWDKRGRGISPPGPQPVTNEMEADDLAAAVKTARSHPRISAVIVAGESAGGYFACLAAANGVQADGYIFLGALASPSLAMFRHNYGRLKEWADRSPENRAWAERNALESLAVGSAYERMFEAAARGEKEYVIEFAGRRFTRFLGRIRTEMERPPLELFKHVRAPAMILQGERDLNVPPGDAELIGQALRSAGNRDVTVIIITGADHSFQYAAESEDDRIRDRFGFTSFYRLYSPRLYESTLSWLRERFPSPAPTVKPAEPPRPGIIAWNGIQVIEDVTDPAVNPGVATLEGRIGPLMKGEGSQAHFIEMPPGLYLHEHPHSTESIIYTVRGRWVLCSSGRRHLMKPGTLYWFRKNEPTGYEVPFDEAPYLLIFKGDRSEMSDEQFWEYLQGLAGRLVQDQAGGERFLLAQLPPEHPARAFARQVNPEWERKLPTTRPAS